MILQSVAITATAATNTIVAAVTGKRILVYRLGVSNAVGTQNAFTVLDGATALTGAIPLPTAATTQIGLFYVWMSSDMSDCPLFITGSGNALNINLAAATPVAGYMQYTIL